MDDPTVAIKQKEKDAKEQEQAETKRNAGRRRIRESGQVGGLNARYLEDVEGDADELVGGGACCSLSRLHAKNARCKLMGSAFLSFGSAGNQRCVH